MGEPESYFDRWDHAQKSFNPIFCWWLWLYSSPLFELRSNFGMGNENNQDLHQNNLCKNCYIQHPSPCCSPLSADASAGDSYTLTGKSYSISCGDTSPYSWLLVHIRFCLCLLWNFYNQIPLASKVKFPGVFSPFGSTLCGEVCSCLRTSLTVQQFLWIIMWMIAYQLYGGLKGNVLQDSLCYKLHGPGL